jgi:alanyl-tRNA synthetase
MTSTNDIRRSFLDYFGSEGHRIVPSAPLVPQNDPTLMFVNAGMVPFKNVFTGLETRPYITATSSQKCVRAGGKHNDLDNVGYTARHHTFFEMLGNFSFGDYFKERAITLAWNLVTKEWGISPDKLTVTVYHTDDEAFDLWKKIAGLPDQRIIRIPTKDNFWAMGDSGPCGPCSEIFYDHGDHIYGGPPGSPEEDGDRFTEIWNLVFMQYEQEANEIVGNLPKPSIDTGMGLERIAAVMQGVHDNYDTDTFKALIAASGELTKRTATDGDNKASHRVIADHLRTAGFLVSDGVLPANEGRGYVLRRIMRRAMRHAHLLGAAEPLMYRLVPSLIAEMGAGLSRTGPRAAADRGDAEAGGDAFPPDARQWLASARRGDGIDGSGRYAARRGRVQALRYVRLPLRSHRGCAARAGLWRRSRRLRCGDGRAEGRRPRRLEGIGRQGIRRSLVRCRRGAGQHRIHRL